MTEWRLEYDGHDPEEEPLREALCTLGNGTFATRGGHVALGELRTPRSLASSHASPASRS